jgi:hypothetical protein
MQIVLAFNSGSIVLGSAALMQLLESTICLSIE